MFTKIYYKKILILFFSCIIFNQFANAAPNYTYTSPNSYKYNNVITDNDREDILFIVDFSNSMNENFGRDTKISVAFSTMKEILAEIPQNTKVGLRVYGHKVGIVSGKSCRASELISPIVPNNTVNLYNQLTSVTPVGWTPITYALKQAVFVDFAGNNSKKRIILISDGGENCDESPCDFIIELMKYRNDIKIDVIALAIGDKEANNQLKCVSLVTSGKFYTANTAAELKNSLRDSLRLQKEVNGVILRK